MTVAATYRPAPPRRRPTSRALRAIAAAVVEKGGDYVKGNQGSLFEDVRLYLDDPAQVPTVAASQPAVDADHGRIETRQAFVCTEIDWLRDHRWPGLAAVGKITRRREINGTASQETAYYL